MLAISLADGTGVLGSTSTAIVQWWAGHTSKKSAIKNDLLFHPLGIYT
jgi:hypothetical protein